MVCIGRGLTRGANRLDAIVRLRFNRAIDLRLLGLGTDRLYDGGTAGFWLILRLNRNWTIDRLIHWRTITYRLRHGGLCGLV